jgi:hypothetical protein
MDVGWRVQFSQSASNLNLGYTDQTLNFGNE